MIRRWSCIIDLNNNFNSYNFFLKNYKINTFKSSVNFKKFTFKFTKFKRKSLIRLKHKTNWLMYTNVIKLWIRDYFFNKNYLRYQFFNKIFNNNFFFYNFNFIKNRNETFFNNFNFIFSTFKNKNYYYFHKNNFMNFKNSSIISAWLFSKPVLNNSILPVFSKWDDFYVDYSFNENLDQSFNFENIFDFLFLLFLKKNTEINKILSLLMHYAVFNFKKVK